MAENRWDRVYADDAYHYGTRPNDWVKEAIERYMIDRAWFHDLGLDDPSEVHVVELAAGEGRNAVWLAQQGFDVTAFDRSYRGSEKTTSLSETKDTLVTARTDDVLDLVQTAEGWRGFAHVVVSTFFHVPPERKGELLAAHRAFVRPGGLLIAEWFHPDQRLHGYRSGGPPSAEMLFTPEEIRAAFSDWSILVCRRLERDLDEGPGHRGPGVVTQLAASPTAP